MQEDEKKEKTNVPRPKASNRDHSVGAVVDEDRILGLDKEYSGWDVYNNEAKKVDMELVKDWTSSLNFLLVFVSCILFITVASLTLLQAAIFAAVLTAFIIESKKLLEQDSTSVMAEVMIFYTNNVANGTHTPYIPVDFQPKVTDVIVNCLFYASLSASLVAALASVVSLQWVADYDAAITRGGSSPEDRAKRRQFRYAGVISWKMNEVIAALPLLLYFSVILFFAGLILWMWTVNYIVGTVIATGAGVAVLFYATSTLVAVAFVSAPFRTPLSRWIYSLSRLPFSFIYRILRIAHVTTVPEWLEQAHRSFTIAYKREDEAVKTRVGLARDALVWLAGHLSISQDSYRRLLLLAGELPNLEHMPSFTRAEGDWYTIFDLLGWKYLSPNHVDNITTEDIEGMAVLQRCCMLPAVQKLVSPSPQIPYITSLEEIKYWSQYCIAGIGDPWTSNNRRPNRLFLLLRDTPHSSEGSTLEIELTLRIAYWRNLDVKLPQVWNEIFALEGSLSSSFFDYCVTTFSNFCRLQNWYKWGKEYSEMYLSVTAEVVRIASRRDDLTSQAVESLIQAYEALQIGYGNPNLSGRSLPHLIRPFPYGKAIENASDDNNAHELLPFLLSRNINSYPSAKRIMRAQEVIAMLWIRPTNPTIRNWDYLMQQPESINGDIVTRMDWVAEADRIPHIKEILGHLATAQSKDPSMGPLWRTTKAKQINDPHFVEALETFDVLMQQNCTSADHLAMISLVCQDLEIEQRPNFTNYFTLRRLESISRLSDPCLKVLANCARGIKYITSINPSEYDNDKRRDSWDRVGQFLLRQYTNNQQIPVLRLQASLWPMLYGQKWLYKRALEQPDFFVRLDLSLDSLLITY